MYLYLEVKCCHNKILKHMSLALGLKNLQEDVSENLEELGELEKSIREAFRDSVAM